MEREDDGMIQSIRKNTKTGRPCGDESFIEGIEETLRRMLPRGRHRKGK